MEALDQETKWHENSFGNPSIFSLLFYLVLKKGLHLEEVSKINAFMGNC